MCGRRIIDGCARLKVKAGQMGFPGAVRERDELGALGLKCLQRIGGSVGEMDDDHRCSSAVGVCRWDELESKIVDGPARISCLSWQKCSQKHEIRYFQRTDRLLIAVGHRCEFGTLWLLGATHLVCPILERRRFCRALDHWRLREQLKAVSRLRAYFPLTCFYR